MLEGLPWPAQLGVAALGWFLAAAVCVAVVRGFIRGELYPRATVEELQRRDAAKDKTIAELAATNKTLTESTALANAVMENLNRAASEVKNQ